MNTNNGMPGNHQRDGIGDDQLLWQLRALRREEMPEADLWPGIAARIAAQPQPAVGGSVIPLRRRGRTRLLPWALAASLAAAVGVAWQLRPEPVVSPPAAPLAARTAENPLIHREADAMAREYDAALRELQAGGRPTPPVDHTLRELDRSAEQIRTALRRDPDARFLLERLRHTYEKRLELTQRAVLS